MDYIYLVKRLCNSYKASKRSDIVAALATLYEEDETEESCDDGSTCSMIISPLTLQVKMFDDKRDSGLGF